jgi:hypothetical protein
MRKLKQQSKPMKPTPIKILLLGFALLAFAEIYSGLSPARPYSQAIGPISGFTGLFLIVGSIGWLWGQKSSKGPQ